MVDETDLEPQKEKIEKLEEMSIEALKNYISELHGEIKRVEGEIKIKTAAQESADSFFKS